MLAWLIDVVGKPSTIYWDNIERYYVYAALVLVILISIVIFKLFIGIISNIFKN